MTITINYKNHICGFSEQCGLAHCNDRIPSQCGFYSTESACKVREAQTVNTSQNCTCMFGNPYEGLQNNDFIYQINGSTNLQVWFCGGENQSYGNPWTILAIIFFTIFGVILAILIVLPSIYLVCAKMHDRRMDKKTEKASKKKKQKKFSNIDQQDQLMVNETMQQSSEYLNIEQLNSTTSTFIGIDNKQLKKQMKKKGKR